MLKYNYFLRNIGLLFRAWWQSGYAEDCKSLDAGSIPTQASTYKTPKNWVFFIGRDRTAVRIQAVVHKRHKV